METDLLIPIFWTVLFSALIVLSFRKLTKKEPSDKKWVRPEQSNKDV
tara:strand:+ start:401 stop:541 length:141 start_codon:yes stop_codon:yes gene_type:complete